MYVFIYGGSRWENSSYRCGKQHQSWSKGFVTMAHCSKFYVKTFFCLFTSLQTSVCELLAALATYGRPPCLVFQPKFSQCL